MEALCPPGIAGVPAAPLTPAYNPGMRTSLLLITLLTAANAFAQPAIEREGTPDPRQNQKIERLHVEDEGNRIDEVRVGGQTQSVTVQPKGNVPAYELQPTDMARSRPGEGREGLAAGRQRVWNVFGF
jgi:hypothetical protein